MERDTFAPTGFVKNLTHLTMVGATALATYGLLVSNDSDCIDGVKHNDALYACNTEDGIEIRHKDGESVILYQREACNTDKTYLDGDEARVYKNEGFAIRVTTVYPATNDVSSTVYPLPFITAPDC